MIPDPGRQPTRVVRFPGAQRRPRQPGRLPGEQPQVELALRAVEQPVDVVGVGQPDEGGPDRRVDDVAAAASRARPAGRAASPGTSRPSPAATRATRSGSAGSTTDEHRRREQHRHRLDDEHRADARPDPATAAEPANTDQIAPATAAAAAQDLDQRIAAGHDPREQDRDGALEQVAGDDDARPTCGPSARSALVPPVRPEPIVRGSGPPDSRRRARPTGIEPAR